jgi:hypothetical protein
VRRVLIFALAAGAAACSLLVSVDDLATGAADAGNADAADAASADADAGAGAGADADAADAGDGDAPDSNLYPNPSFETGCGSSTGFDSTVTTDPTAHDGTRSCRICARDGKTTYSAVGAIFVANPPLGAAYVATAYMRKAPGNPDAPKVQGILRLRNDTPQFEQVDAMGGAQPNAADAWQSITAEMTVQKAAQALEFYVTGYSTSTDSCFLVDDITVKRLK